MGQTIHVSRRDLDKEYKQVLRYSDQTVCITIIIYNQRRRGIQKKSSDFDTLWLLQKIKKMTAGVDMKANQDFNLHEKMIIFRTTQQCKTKSDDDYLNRFNSRLENMNLDGGAHVLCSPQIIGKYLSQCTTA